MIFSPIEVIAMNPKLVALEKSFCQLFGVRFYKNLRKLISGKKSGFEELEVMTDFLLPRSRRGLMVDVGAHFGESFKTLAYHGWDVIAVEPDPSPSKHTMIAARSTPRVKELRCALSHTAGQKVPFFVSSESSGVSSLSPFLDSHRPIDQIIETDTLNNVLNQYASDKQVDLLKIDTEGYDLFVLQGLDWSNAKQRPRMVLCEFEDKKTVPLGYNYKKLGDLLVENGYDVWLSEWQPISQYGTAHKWKSITRYPCSLADENGWGNFIAVDPSISKDFSTSLNAATGAHA